MEVKCAFHPVMHFPALQALYQIMGRRCCLDFDKRSHRRRALVRKNVRLACCSCRDTFTVYKQRQVHPVQGQISTEAVFCPNTECESDIDFAGYDTVGIQPRILNLDPGLHRMELEPGSLDCPARQLDLVQGDAGRH